ncbi:MAG: hypothetical protein IPK42_06045 [Betaproteobacteria bacterium]|nr:hypothetical protein [Betaproteobacteria bacterium]
MPLGLDRRGSPTVKEHGFVPSALNLRVVGGALLFIIDPILESMQAHVSVAQDVDGFWVPEKSMSGFRAWRRWSGH